MTSFFCFLGIVIIRRKNLTLLKILFMRNLALLFFFIFTLQAFTQVKRTDKLKIKEEKNRKIENNKVNQPNTNSSNLNNTKINSTELSDKSNSSNDSIAPIDWYKIISSDYKNTVVDTSLTIKSFYNFNYLMKDMFGMQSLSNDGQSYNLIDFSLLQNKVNPSFGFKAKDYNFYQIDDINYYNVPTPFSELAYRSAIKQGQN